MTRKHRFYHWTIRPGDFGYLFSDFGLYSSLLSWGWASEEPWKAGNCYKAWPLRFFFWCLVRQRSVPSKLFLYNMLYLWDYLGIRVFCESVKASRKSFFKQKMASDSHLLGFRSPLFSWANPSSAEIHLSFIREAMI